MNSEDDVCTAEKGTLSKSDCITVLKHLLIYSVHMSKDTHTDRVWATVWWNNSYNIKTLKRTESQKQRLQHNMREGGVWVKLVCEINWCVSWTHPATHTLTLRSPQVVWANRTSVTDHSQTVKRCWTYSHGDWCCVYRQQDKWLWWSEKVPELNMKVDEVYKVHGNDLTCGYKCKRAPDALTGLEHWCLRLSKFHSLQGEKCCISQPLCLDQKTPLLTR